MRWRPSGDEHCLRVMRNHARHEIHVGWVDGGVRRTRRRGSGRGCALRSGGGGSAARARGRGDEEGDGRECAIARWNHGIYLAFVSKNVPRVTTVGKPSGLLGARAMTHTSSDPSLVLPMNKLAFVALAACAAGAAAQAPSADLARWTKQAQGITIIRDDWGIAHIHGKTDADAVFGMMYAQAEDDFNRVETNFINSQGRLAEAEGEAEIPRDLRMKLFIDPDSMKAKY